MREGVGEGTWNQINAIMHVFAGFNEDQDSIPPYPKGCKRSMFGGESTGSNSGEKDSLVPRRLSTELNALFRSYNGRRIRFLTLMSVFPAIVGCGVWRRTCRGMFFLTPRARKDRLRKRLSFYDGLLAGVVRTRFRRARRPVVQGSPADGFTALATWPVETRLPWRTSRISRLLLSPGDIRSRRGPLFLSF